MGIFLVVNGVTQIYLRYTKNLYESSSELKLEVKNDASELGIKNVIEEPNVNILSGEIELIQSKLFLNQVLDNAKLGITYHSVGRVTNEELFNTTPFNVVLKKHDGHRFDQPIQFEQKNNNAYQIKISGDEQMEGEFGKPTQFGGFEMIITRNDHFIAGDEKGYFFTIHSRESQLQYLTRNLSAEPLNYNANTIRISFKDYNASKAQYILNKIDTLYLIYSNEQKNLANRQKINWLSNELAQIEAKMEGFEDYFENFTLQNKTNNLDDDLKNIVKQINELDSQRFRLTQRIDHLDRLKDDLKNRKEVISSSQRHNIPGPVAEAMEELSKLWMEQGKLGMSYNEKTFASRRLQKEVESLELKVARYLDELRRDAVSRLADLNSVKQKLEKEFAHLPDKNTEFSKNLRFYKLNEQLYLTLMQSKSEFEVVQAGTVPDFRILSPASFPSEPISPKRLMISGAGLVISLTLMLLFIGIMYLANSKITSLSELERNLQLPVIGVIPVSRHIRNHGLFVVDQPKSMVSEALRTIRTNLDFFNADVRHKIVSISSTVSGEGKSFIAVNLGAMVALSGKRVVLLDLDMRKKKTNVPAVITDSSKGISTILIKRNTWQESVVKTSIAEFDFVPSGPHPPNPAELLLSSTFEELLEELKRHYDYIIIDTPPVGLVTDGIMAMKHSDLCVYIFRANYSKKEFMLNLQRIININKFTNIGMVLNALPSTGAHKYGYGYYEEADVNSKWTQLFNT